jgi:hypothetical protein
MCSNCKATFRSLTKLQYYHINISWRQPVFMLHNIHVIYTYRGVILSDNSSHFTGTVVVTAGNAANAAISISRESGLTCFTLIYYSERYVFTHRVWTRCWQWFPSAVRRTPSVTNALFVTRRSSDGDNENITFWILFFRSSLRWLLGRAPTCNFSVLQSFDSEMPCPAHICNQTIGRLT